MHQNLPHEIGDNPGFFKNPVLSLDRHCCNRFSSVLKKEADDTKGSFQFLRSNCPVRFADLVIDVKLFAGSGQGDKVE